MDADEFKRRRDKMGLTQQELAKELDVAARTVIRWEKGSQAIPKSVELALKHLETERRG